MENWQLEIQRLDNIRKELGLNFSQLEKKIGIQRELLGRYFKFECTPGLKSYFKLKEVLENEQRIRLAEVVEPEFPEEVVGEFSIPKPTADKIVKTINRQKIVPAFKEEYQFQNDCDCKIENGLLKRGKIKCKKTKEQHQF